MGELIQFPQRRRMTEHPDIGYCMNCRVAVAWPEANSRWPESCPNGCTPFGIMSWPPSSDGNVSAQVFDWAGTPEGPPLFP